MRGLYKGMSAPLLGATLTKTIDFGLFGTLRNAFGKGAWKDRPLLSVVLAGMMSASTATLVLVPIDRLKIILSLQRSEVEKARAVGASTEGKSSQLQFRGPMDLMRKQGLVGMYRGMAITLCRECLYGATYFSAFQVR